MDYSRLPPRQAQELLVRLLIVAKSRGLQPSTLVIENPSNSGGWNKDEFGYYRRNSPGAGGNRSFRGSEKHNAFVRSKARFSALVGGRGSGKSASGAQKAIAKIEQGLSGAVIAPDFEQFKNSTWPEFVQWIPWNKVIKQHRYRRLPSWEPSRPFVLTFTNGARVICKGLKNPEGARGPNINWLWFDEGALDRTGMAWRIAIAAVRVGDNPQAWTTTTPKGKRHWLYRMFVEHNIPKEAMDLLQQIQGDAPVFDLRRVHINDNKDNLDPAYYASLLAAYGKSWLSLQELGGEFVDEEGGEAQREWFKILLATPRNLEKTVRYWDLAATEKERSKPDPDFTAGGLVSWNEGIYYIRHIVAKQLKWKSVKQLIAQTAAIDGIDVPIYIEQEGGAGGKGIVEEIMAMPELIGYQIEGHRPIGDKVFRGNVWFSQAEAHNVYICNDPARAWDVEDFLVDVESFPGVEHDDRIDCVSGAVQVLGGNVTFEDVQSAAQIERTKWEIGEQWHVPVNQDNPVAVTGTARWSV